MVTSVNDNGTYHLAELDGTQIAVPVVGKRIKEFKKQYVDEPNPDCAEENDGHGRTDEDGGGYGSEDDE